MTDAKEALKLYNRKNNDGRFDDAIYRWSGIYRSQMNQLLGRD